MVISQEIAIRSANESEARSHAPMLPEGLRVFRLEINAAAILADHGFEREAAIHVDGVAGVSDKRARGSSHWRVWQSRTVFGNHLACIASDERPFARLSLELE